MYAFHSGGLSNHFDNYFAVIATVRNIKQD